MTTRVGILLFEHVDLLDAGGPYEVFLTAGRLVERGGAVSPFDVVTAGVGPGAVIAYGGLGLVPTHTFDNVGPLNVLVIPGAIAIDAVNSAINNSHFEGILIECNLLSVFGKFLKLIDSKLEIIHLLFRNLSSRIVFK